jgi:Flp pilus assembly protein TadB
VTATALAVAWAIVCAGWFAHARPTLLGRSFAPTARPTLPFPRRFVATLVVALGLSVLFPPAGLAVLAAVAIRPLLQRRRQQRAQLILVERDLADVVALIGLAVGAGANLSGALDAAAAHADGPLADAIGAAVQTTRRGGRIADALEQLPHQLGETVRPFVAALVSCDRYGAPLGATLDRLALDVRTASRQRAEAAARRLPVRLLFPLVSCILPAFALLTVAPLVAGSFQGLGF